MGHLADTGVSRPPGSPPSRPQVAGQLVRSGRGRKVRKLIGLSGRQDGGVLRDCVFVALGGEVGVRELAAGHDVRRIGADRRLGW